MRDIAKEGNKQYFSSYHQRNTRTRFSERLFKPINVSRCLLNLHSEKSSRISRTLPYLKTSNKFDIIKDIYFYNMILLNPYILKEYYLPTHIVCNKIFFFNMNFIRIIWGRNSGNCAATVAIITLSMFVFIFYMNVYYFCFTPV